MHTPTTARPVARPRRAPAPAESIGYTIGASTLGLVLVARGAAGLVAMLLGDDRDALRAALHERFPRATLVADDAALRDALAWAVARIDHPTILASDAIALDARGTAFQRRVWDALRAVPVGTTVTYAEIAARIGAPAGVRAVAQACAANPLAVVVPCHRVVRSDGSLSGYRWGVARKRALLERERGS
jgi:AraC family transcriptional regulator of adaptative response/methylated-DNA-[protein]-cysteine methyltransferase